MKIRLNSIISEEECGLLSALSRKYQVKTGCLGDTAVSMVEKGVVSCSEKKGIKQIFTKRTMRKRAKH
jgi:hypothetical protein